MTSSHLQTLHLEHLPPGYDVHIALYKDLRNAEFLQKQLLEGNTAFEYALIDASVVRSGDSFTAEYLRTKRMMSREGYQLTGFQIISQIHILSAVYRATNNLVESRLRSRNVHSEIVFSLSPNNNVSLPLLISLSSLTRVTSQIAASFRTFGVLPTIKNLILIKVTTPSTPEFTAENVANHISSAVEGEQVPFNDEEIAKMTDWAKVKKIYKLHSVPMSSGGKKATNGVVEHPGEDEVKELEVMILGSMALRGAAS